MQKVVLHGPISLHHANVEVFAVPRVHGVRT